MVVVTDEQHVCEVVVGVVVQVCDVVLDLCVIVTTGSGHAHQSGGTA